MILDNNLMNKCQSGALPGHSTSFQLIDIYHHIYVNRLTPTRFHVWYFVICQKLLTEFGIKGLFSNYVRMVHFTKLDYRLFGQ